MIVSCPVCRTRYLVDEDGVARAGRPHRALCQLRPYLASGGAARAARGTEDAAEARRRGSNRRSKSRRVRRGAWRPRSSKPRRGRAVRLASSPEPLGARSAGWLLALLFVLAILAGVVVARGAVVAIWPPAGAALRLGRGSGRAARRRAQDREARAGAHPRRPDHRGRHHQYREDGARSAAAAGRAARRRRKGGAVQDRRSAAAAAAAGRGRSISRRPFDHPDDAATGVVVTFASRAVKRVSGQPSKHVHRDEPLQSHSRARGRSSSAYGQRATRISRDVPGFVEFHLLRGPEREDHVLYSSHTIWRSRDDFEAWTRSEAFRLAHHERRPEQAALSRASRIRGVRGHPDGYAGLKRPEGR